jgi:hypothetical protein
MKYLATALAYLLSLLVIAAVSLAIVLLVAGPHSGLLPAWLEPWVLGLGWLVILFVPVLVARKVWRRLDRSARVTGSPPA